MFEFIGAIKIIGTTSDNISYVNFSVFPPIKQVYYTTIAATITTNAVSFSICCKK